jgi:hypothetical protein
VPSLAALCGVVMGCCTGREAMLEGPHGSGGVSMAVRLFRQRSTFVLPLAPRPQLPFDKQLKRNCVNLVRRMRFFLNAWRPMFACALLA